MKTIYELARENPRISQFADMLESSDLKTKLSSPGLYTLFAPENEVIEKESHRLTEYAIWDDRPDREYTCQHLFAGSFFVNSLINRPLLINFAGLAVLIRAEDGFSIGGAEVVEQDLLASNGVLHIVNRSLIPNLEQSPSESLHLLTRLAQERMGVTADQTGFRSSSDVLRRSGGRSMLKEETHDG